MSFSATQFSTSTVYNALPFFQPIWIENFSLTLLNPPQRVKIQTYKMVLKHYLSNHHLGFTSKDSEAKDFIPRLRILPPTQDLQLHGGWIIPGCWIFVVFGITPLCYKTHHGEITAIWFREFPKKQPDPEPERGLIYLPQSPTGYEKKTRIPSSQVAPLPWRFG